MKLSSLPRLKEYPPYLILTAYSVLILVPLGWMATFGLPFAITVLDAFFLDFPGEIVEAARLDGCSELGVLWRIVVPLSMSAVASVAIFQGVQIWNEFLLALVVISDDALKSVPLGLVYADPLHPLPETIYPQPGRVDQITSHAFHATQLRSLDLK